MAYRKHAFFCTCLGFIFFLKKKYHIKIKKYQGNIGHSRKNWRNSIVLVCHGSEKSHSIDVVNLESPKCHKIQL
jgi:hypothetical protein